MSNFCIKEIHIKNISNSLIINQNIGNPYKAIFFYYRSNKSKQTDNRRHAKWLEQTDNRCHAKWPEQTNNRCYAKWLEQNRCHAKWPEQNRCHAKWPEQTESVAIARANRHRSKLQLANYFKILSRMINPTK